MHYRGNGRSYAVSGYAGSERLIVRADHPDYSAYRLVSQYLPYDDWERDRESPFDRISRICIGEGFFSKEECLETLCRYMHSAESVLRFVKAHDRRFISMYIMEGAEERLLRDIFAGAALPAATEYVREAFMRNLMYWAPSYIDPDGEMMRLRDMWRSSSQSEELRSMIFRINMGDGIWHSRLLSIPEVAMLNEESAALTRMGTIPLYM